MNNKESHHITNTDVALFIEKLKGRLNHIQQPLKLIIHAGTPKTGTTSLQVYLEKNKVNLNEKAYFTPIVLITRMRQNISG